MALPEWIRREMRASSARARRERSVECPTVGSLRRQGVRTVCKEARCPNSPTCFAKPTATFLILGDRCTRTCSFCAVTKGTPHLPDPDEPRRVAEAAREMGLRYVVITSVTRDDMTDGGAGAFAETVRLVRSLLPASGVEVLTPDFRGDRGALQTVIEAGPDVFNHNVETVARLYPTVRPQADYRQSLRVLEMAGGMSRSVRTKSGLMLGLGETLSEVIEVLRDLRDSGCRMVTIGQYLRPSKNNIPVVEYKDPGFFADLREVALGMGFDFVASAPLVRSSMNAEEMYEGAGGLKPQE